MENQNLSEEQVEALNNGIPATITRPGRQKLKIVPPEGD